MLARIPRRSPVILTNSRRRPWAQGSLGDRFVKAKKEAWPDGNDLHFHDLRGTAATKFYIAGLSEREIAEIMGWEEETCRSHHPSLRRPQGSDQGAHPEARSRPKSERQL